MNATRVEVPIPSRTQEAVFPVDTPYSNVPLRMAS